MEKIRPKGNFCARQKNNVNKALVISALACRKVSIEKFSRTSIKGLDMYALGATLFLAGFASGYIARWWRHGCMDGEDDDLSDIDENDAVHEGDTSDALPEECKMVLGVRMDLKMDKGKIAAQCGHATLGSYRSALRLCPEYVRTWQKLGQTKIAIKIPDEEHLLQVRDAARKLGIPAQIIQDAYVRAY